jgi:hypothetical protein
MAAERRAMSLLKKNVLALSAPSLIITAEVWLVASGSFFNLINTAAHPGWAAVAYPAIMAAGIGTATWWWRFFHKL